MRFKRKGRPTLVLTLITIVLFSSLITSCSRLIQSYLESISPPPEMEYYLPPLDNPGIVYQTGHSESISSIVISPDGKLGATSSSDGTVRVWDMAAGREIKRIYGFEGSRNTLKFTPDGKYLVFSFRDGSWKTAQLLQSWRATMRA